MAKTELGTKRIDPETGKKFYDLNRDPIISPYTNLSYPRSYFENATDPNEDREDVSENALDAVLEKSSFVSLEEVEDDGKTDDLPDLDDDDTFLPDDEDDDMSGIIGAGMNSDGEH